ncbi:MAG: carotenoid oxygenase family protein [Phycisphaerales bacterium]|nr:carotenoid oxygenase family protein [Hyphomonadaceae bacterium]
MLGFHDQAKFATPAMFAALGDDTHDRADAGIVVRGELPSGLKGVLYRNGPGRFRRGDEIKRTVLDGDGVMQRLEFADGVAHYARRFVKTPKLLAEEHAGRFLKPSWTTTVPGLLANVGQHIQGTAGVTTYDVNGILLALDEGGASPGCEIDRDTLETLRPASLGLPDNDASPKPHAKRIAESGDWLFASTRYGAKGMQIDVVRHRRDGTRVATPTVLAPRVGYLHDFAATNRHAIFTLQAVELHSLRFLAGLASFSECIEWKPELGNIIVLINLATGEHRTFEAPPAWAWHMANAYEQGDAVIMDFVGYDDPGHFIGPDAQLAAIMHGKEGVNGAPGTIRRLVLSANGTLAETVLADGNFEFPQIDLRASGAAHERIYVTSCPTSGFFHTGIAALEVRTGRLDSYDFGASVNTGEPVFAADPNGGPDQGWLITQTLDVQRVTSGFAVLEAQNVAAGPVATVEVGQTMPLSLHGQWVAATPPLTQRH